MNLHEKHWDLHGALQYNDEGVQYLTDVDIDEVLLECQGENDGAEWHWIVRLNEHTVSDGRYAYITGGCDFTGWDCQSIAEAHIRHTLDEAIAEAGEVFSAVFRDMLRTGDRVRKTTEILEAHNDAA